MPQRLANPGSRDRWRADSLSVAFIAWGRAGQGRHLSPHIVVETPTGSLSTGNSCWAKRPCFPEDPVRGYDHDIDPSWKYDRDRRPALQEPGDSARIAAWIPVWTAFIGGMIAYSMDPRQRTLAPCRQPRP
jgi:hypothetical protein